MSVRTSSVILGGSRCKLRSIGSHVLRFVTITGLGKDVDNGVLYLINPPKINGASVNQSITETLNQRCFHFDVNNLISITRVGKRQQACIKTVPKGVIRTLGGIRATGPLVLMSRVSGVKEKRRKSPTDTLLRLLSPRRGSSFLSRCLSVPLGLDGILFVYATGRASAVPTPLLSHVRVVGLSNCITRRGVRVTGACLLPRTHLSTKVSRGRVIVRSSTVRTLVGRCYQRDNIEGLGGGVRGVFQGTTLGLIGSDVRAGATAASAPVAIYRGGLRSFINGPVFADSQLCRKIRLPGNIYANVT